MYSTDYSAELRTEKYLLTIKELRSNNFRRNLPFLMLSNKLPEGHVYREYPDGHIELQHIYTVGSNFEYTVVRILSTTEADKIREDFGLMESTI
jgi:hypothetical protein